MTTIFGGKKGASAVVDNPANPTSVLVDPVGGLELNSSNELRIKRDGGVQTNADGTSVIDRVETAGDTMTGDLLLSNTTSGPDIVRRLGCLDLGDGKVFSIPVGNVDNQLQFVNGQTPLTVETTHGFGVDVVGVRRFEVGASSTTVSNPLSMGFNKVTLVADPTTDHDVANKRYVDSRKPLITVWAEERGSIANGTYEWSFGNGGEGEVHRRIGFTMLASGRVLRMGLSATTSSGPSGEISIVIAVNGVVYVNYIIIKPDNQYSSTTTFQTPLEVSEGDRINFRSQSQKA